MSRATHSRSAVSTADEQQVLVCDVGPSVLADTSVNGSGDPSITAMGFQSSDTLGAKDQHHVMFKISKIGFPIVIVFCIVLLIAFIALAILYSQELNKSSESSQPCDETRPKKYEICVEEKCFKLGLAMVQKMNKSADPCQDFYAYACGGWQQRNPLKNNDSRINTGTIVIDENIEVLKTALDHVHLNYSMNDAVMKTARAYNSCMNTSAIDAQGLQPLNKLIDEYGGWTLSSNNYNPSVSIATRMAKALRELNVESLFGVFVRVNPLNSDENVLVFSRSSFGLLTQQKYLNRDKDSEEKLQAYKKYMKAVSQMFNAPYEKMMAIYDIEVKLAKISSGKDPDAELMDYLKKISKSRISRRSSSLHLIITLNMFCRQTGFSCSLLKEVLSITFAREFTGYERVLALPSTKRFFKTLYYFYIDSEDWLLADYIMWRVVNHYLEALPIKYRSAKDNFLERTALPRWKQCILRMFKAFDLSLGLLYVDVRFDDKTKIKINEIIENLRTSFIERLPNQTWMDSDTQEMAKKKAQAIIAEIGYPRFIKNPEKLKEYYEKFKVTDDLFENYKAANHFIRMRNLKYFEIPVDKNEWSFGSPADYNGFYSPYLNRIIFLAGILQPPMYSPGYPRYLNYGGIGMVIGHEITHGFDGTGRFYDKDGNVNDWWSSSSEEIFEQKSKCFVAQYNKYGVFDKHINGTQTLNENIADNGGIHLAYDAYQRWTEKNGAEQILPGLDLNPDQLFFLGFAQSWCGIYSKKGAYEQLEIDSHSMGKYRVIGSLTNFEKFSKAFNCPTNSSMNPVNKCGIW